MEHKDLIHIIETKRKLQSLDEPKRIEDGLKGEINFLKEKGYSDEEIKKAFKQEVILEAQGNEVMLKRNKQYEELVKKILGEKNENGNNK